MLPVAEIKNLDISFEPGVESTVKNISFVIPRGKIVALTGESGSGKSLTALSFLKLLPASATLSGNIVFSEDGLSAVDLLHLPNKDLRNIRGNRIAMIFQEPMTSLNPVHTCGAQVTEAIRIHTNLSKKQAELRALALFTKVELPLPGKMMKRYPHEISGGQKQRVMIAMAMSCNPSLLIADEPTTALDVRVQKNILRLLVGLQKENNMSVLLITHDLALVSEYADEILVMNRGEIVERGNVKDVLSDPGHEYTKKLLAARKENVKKEKSQVRSIDNLPENILQVQNLVVGFPVKRSFFGKAAEVFNAVDDVSFSVKRNETVGLVGESGCGKTTLGRSILQLIRPASGKIIFEGREIFSADPESIRLLRKDMQIVFQDPYGSLNPRLTIGDAIAEPILVHHNLSKSQRKEMVADLLQKVKLDPDVAGRYPHRFSGGQRQRICIARALAVNPDFLIFDESVSALDMSVQAQVLDLIRDLKSSLNFSSIFISHDLQTIHAISDQVMVMKKGKIIESGSADEIFYFPKENYTCELLEAAPKMKFLQIRP